MRRLRHRVIRQVVQARRRRADIRQEELVQYDGKYTSKMRAKREAWAMCGVAPYTSLRKSPAYCLKYCLNSDQRLE